MLLAEESPAIQCNPCEFVQSMRSLKRISINYLVYITQMTQMLLFTRHSRAFALKPARKLSTLHVFLPKRASLQPTKKHITSLKPQQQTQKPTNLSPTMSEATPRITAPYLEQFSHQTVRILGKVRQLRGEQATIDAGGQISVFLNRVR